MKTVVDTGGGGEPLEPPPEPPPQAPRLAARKIVSNREQVKRGYLCCADIVMIL
jgi:hypothetical protein